MKILVVAAGCDLVKKEKHLHMDFRLYDLGRMLEICILEKK